MSSLRILVVDDHVTVRRELSLLLSSHPDWTVCGEASDGIEAVELAKKLRPHAVLMDVSMPRMNGLDATRILRREVAESKVIIVSQNDPEVVRQQAEEVDAAAYVAKRDLADQLLPTLDRLFENANTEVVSDGRPIASGSVHPGWLEGGGALGRLIREHDWSQTSLGPIEGWPQSLKTSVNLILNARHPMWVGWGPDAVFLYNDAYVQVLSLAKHPWALGKPTAEVWPEIWDIIGPLIDNVYEKGEPSFLDDIRFLMNRGDFVEETYYSFSYSPVRDESGIVAGLFCPTTEVTPKVINARRLGTLAELSANSLVQKTTEAACASVVAALGKNPDDLPFTLLYLIDSEGRSARLEQSCGVPRGIETLSPDTVELAVQDRQGCLWPVAEVVNSAQSQVVAVGSVEGLPLGVAQQRLSEAVVLPITSRAEGGMVGVLVAGVNPARKLDSEYRTFYELAAGQIATSILNARAAEEERRRLEALAEIDRAKTAFFSNVSHEFRTPLTLMLGPVEDLLSRSHTDLSPAAKNQLELVNRNGARLLRLVNTLLDFSRLEAGRLQAMFEPTNLSHFTLELASVFRSATERAGLKLELDCPPLAEPVFVDRSMWEKIVLNLISNAFKFTFEGIIAVSLIDDGERVELRVRDTGVGIPAEELPRLFDRFHRIENSRSRTHEGSGIGLALVQELAKLHGGFVRVESVLGQGSTFSVSLPKGRAHLATDRISATRNAASTAGGATPYVEEALRWLPDAGQTQGADEILTVPELLPFPYGPGPSVDARSEPRARILVVEDNADMRQYLVRLLAERYEVGAAPDGRVALESVREHPPDLVLTDVMMPNLDGFGLLREMRSDPAIRTIPIILLSARAGEEARVEGIERGADDYLIKPFSAREMLARVQTHLELSRVRKESEDALRRRTEQFASLVNEAPLGVYVVDADLRILQVNPTTSEAFGEVSALIGRGVDELIHILWPAASGGDVIDHFRRTLETGEPYIVAEHREERLDRGVVEFYEWQVNRIPLPDGRFGLVCYYRDISRMVHAREAIAESERRLRLASEAAELGIWHWYLEEGRATWENDRPYEIFGRAREEGPISAEEFKAEILHPMDTEKFERAVSLTLQTGVRFFFQGRIKRKDGSAGWVEFTGQLERRADGSPWRILGTILDITQRLQDAETLRQHRERFEMVAEASQVGFWFCDLPFDKLIWDNRVKEHFWLPAEAEVTIDTFYERLHPEDRERTRQTIAESNANDIPYNIEYRTVAPDGREKWIRAIGRTFYDAAGQPKRFDGVTLDITERRRIEERERQMTAEALAATTKFRAVFDETPVFAGIMTVDGKVIDANRLCLDACGYRAEEVVGQPFWETGWWRGSTEVQGKIRNATEQAALGVPYREDLPYHWADGTERLVDFALHPIRDHQGEIIFLHPTGIDITDLKHAEQNYRTLVETLDAEVQARTRELESRNVEVVRQSELLRELSRRLMQAQDDERRHVARELHDSAGQTLTALGMNLARLAQQARKTSPELALDAEEGKQLVLELSQEIRTMSYLLHPPLLDDNGIGEALHWYIRGLEERSGLKVSLVVPEDLGRFSSDLELAVFRIVQECLTNVHRHSGSKVATIRIAQDGERISLEVRDEGKGISPEKLLQLQSKGGGVGIRGMRERVLQLGGEMRLDSDSNGTLIAITLPIATGTRAEDRQPAPALR